MSVSLDPSVLSLVDSGNFVVIPLVRIDLPEMTVGYHYGGRPFDYLGVTYLPNRYLMPEGLNESLGEQIGEVQLIFSNVPTDNVEDAVAQVETLTYLNAPITISYLAGNPDTDEVIGVIATKFYEVAEVNYEDEAMSSNGDRAMTLTITAQSPARRLRDKTYARRASADQNYHNDPTDTIFEYANAVKDWTVEWGQK